VRGPDGLQDAIDAGRPPLLRFAAGRLSGSVGCNRLMGSYTSDGERLRFQPNLATTMMACPEPLMAQEKAVVDALAEAASLAIADGTLTIRDADGAALLVLSAGADRPLTGTTWRLLAYNNGRQAVVSALQDSDFTLILRDDGQFAGKACNSYRGGFERDGDGLRVVGPIAATRMACPMPDGIMEQEAAYFAALERLAGYRTDGDELILSDPDGATLAHFRAGDTAD
jgi:heat shock protein HslJ